MRTLYSLQSIWKLKQSSQKGMGYKDVYQAGKSVQGIHTVQPAAQIVAEYAAALDK
jgi:nitronate monooxygenase